MEWNKVIGASIVIISIIGLLLLIPLPGTNSTQTFNISGKQVDFILINDSEIKVEEEDWNAWGEYNLLHEEVKLATNGLPVFQFMSTCSHEVYHVKTPETGGAVDHENMDTIFGFVPPWNWESECFQLLDNRLWLS